MSKAPLISVIRVRLNEHVHYSNRKIRWWKARDASHSHQNGFYSRNVLWYREYAWCLDKHVICYSREKTISFASCMIYILTWGSIVFLLHKTFYVLLLQILMNKVSGVPLVTSYGLHCIDWTATDWCPFEFQNNLKRRSLWSRRQALSTSHRVKMNYDQHGCHWVLSNSIRNQYCLVYYM